MWVSLFTDASFCNKTKCSGFGIWVKSARGKYNFGGPFKTDSISPQHAELKAIINGISIGLNQKIILNGDNVLIQTDCLHSIEVLKKQNFDRYKNRKLKLNIENGLKEIFEIYNKIISDNNLIINFKHVKGHVTKDKEKRHYVNNLCDSLAKKGMLEAKKIKYMKNKKLNNMNCPICKNEMKIELEITGGCTCNGCTCNDYCECDSQSVHANYVCNNLIKSKEEYKYCKQQPISIPKLSNEYLIAQFLNSNFKES